MNNFFSFCVQWLWRNDFWCWLEAMKEKKYAHRVDRSIELAASAIEKIVCVSVLGHKLRGWSLVIEQTDDWWTFNCVHTSKQTGRQWFFQRSIGNSINKKLEREAIKIQSDNCSHSKRRRKNDKTRPGEWNRGKIGAICSHNQQMMMMEMKERKTQLGLLQIKSVFFCGFWTTHKCHQDRVPCPWLPGSCSQRKCW